MKNWIQNWNSLLAFTFIKIKIQRLRIQRTNLYTNYSNYHQPTSINFHITCNYHPKYWTFSSETSFCDLCAFVFVGKLHTFLATEFFKIFNNFQVYLFIKHTNQSLLKQICNPKRTRIFTVSQQCQVKENLRALRVTNEWFFNFFY